MKKKILYTIVCSAILLIIIFANKPKIINASDIITMTQSNYSSIKFNEKIIIAYGNQQYLIDDFIPKLARYTLEPYNGYIDSDYSYRTELNDKNGNQIIILDNNYMIVNDNIYEITNGDIDFNKLYQFYLD